MIMFLEEKSMQKPSLPRFSALLPFKVRVTFLSPFQNLSMLYCAISRVDALNGAGLPACSDWNQSRCPSEGDVALLPEQPAVMIPKASATASCSLFVLIFNVV